MKKFGLLTRKLRLIKLESMENKNFNTFSSVFLSVVLIVKKPERAEG
jgi:hypothetical protein